MKFLGGLGPKETSRTQRSRIITLLITNYISGIVERHSFLAKTRNLVSSDDAKMFLFRETMRS